MSSKSMPLSVFVIILVILLAACAKPQAATQPAVQNTAPAATLPPAPTSPASSRGIDACALLTHADAEQILGLPVEAPTHPVEGSETFIVTSCEYKVQGGSPLDNANLIVTIPADGDAQTARTAFDTGEQQAQTTWGVAPVDVPGVGDSAYWVAGVGNNLSVLKGNVYLNLSASTQKGETPTQAVLDLTKSIISRLP